MTFLQINCYLFVDKYQLLTHLSNDQLENSKFMRCFQNINLLLIINLAIAKKRQKKNRIVYSGKFF